MENKIKYIFIRFAIFITLGLFFTLLPMRHDEVGEAVFPNTEQKIWIMVWAAIFATVWVLAAFLFLRADRKKVIQEAEKVLKNLEQTEKRKTLRGTLEELHEKYVHLEDCRNKILQWESDEKYIVKHSAYLRGVWREESVAPSFLSSEYYSWAGELDEFKKRITEIVEPYSLLDTLSKLEIERQEADTKIRAMLDKIDNQPSKFTSVLKAETTRMRDYLTNMNSRYEQAITLEMKFLAVSDMRDFIVQINTIQRLVELLCGERDILEYERGLCANDNEALLFRICYAISQTN